MSFSPSNVLFEEFYSVHEAGHALAWWYHGLTLLLVSIAPDPLENDANFGGVCKCFFNSKVEPATHRMLTAEYAYGVIAGRVATEVLCPQVPPGVGHANDFQHIKNLRALDSDVLSMHAWRLKHPDADPDQFYADFKTPVLNILKSKRGKRALLALSKALLKYRKLSGREAARILEEAWGYPLPPFAVPSEQHSSLVSDGPKSFNDLMRQILLYAEILKKDILPLRDSDKNTTYQNNIVEKILEELLLVQILAAEDQLKNK